MIVTSESKETPDLRHYTRGFPLQHITDLAWIYRNTSVGDDMTQKRHFLEPELTLAELCI
jgi:hypothetical protein